MHHLQLRGPNQRICATSLILEHALSPAENNDARRTERQGLPASTIGRNWSEELPPRSLRG